MKLSSVVITSLLAASTSFASEQQTFDVQTPSSTSCSSLILDSEATFDEGKKKQRQAKRRQRKQRRRNKNFAGACGF